MKIKSFLLALTAGLSAVLSAQTDAILWKISGNGLKTPSYIFGTVHVYCGGEKFYSPDLINALKSTEVVAMELNLNDFHTFVTLMKASMREAEKPLSSKLSTSEYKSVDSACIALLGDSLKNLDMRTPMALMAKMYMSESFIACNPVPIDFLISEMAKRENKVSFGFETAEFQDSILNTAPDSIQIQWLLELSRNISKAKEEFTALINAYNDQSSLQLYNLIFKTSPEIEFMQDVLLNQRNIAWMNYLKTNLKLNSYFIAVGAAHLRGDQGMLALLTQAGYTLTPIHIQF